ncbi:hypothetical protein [Paenibacillus solani]|uniref:GTPase SAR1 n=1 Tax=Paenibacillus solani TaxID=1705565 RepID=A0A0M1P4I0_9BACL|nr:hypothetical protein [Paenibacillus solani]KOR88944.1 hypothetical protein AM231_07040 [Paenibacillus solani]
MTSKDILIVVLIVSLILFTITFGIAAWMSRRQGYRDAGAVQTEMGGRSWRDIHRQWFQIIYRYGIKIPVVKSYLRRIRQRIAIIHPYDEIALRYETVKLTIAITGTIGLTALLLIWSQPDLGFIVIVILAAAVINNMLVEMFINRLERKVLVQSVELFSLVRHHYQQHGMVEEALYEGAEASGHEISLHAHRIYNALVSEDPDEELEQYYEVAPNRYLKAFAGISHLVMEFGDHARKKGSIYLHGLSGLTKEIQLEILRRDKLDYLMKGLNIIALAPVFFTRPIERWARSSFPSMDDFYMSKLGIITKISIYVIILIAYLLLQKLQQNRETDYRAEIQKLTWEERLYRLPAIRLLVRMVSPSPGSLKYDRQIRLLKESNARIKFEWLYIRRLMFFLLTFLLSLSLAVGLHVQAKHHILHVPVSLNNSLFGQMNEIERRQAEDTVKQDRMLMEHLQMSPDLTREQVRQVVHDADSLGMAKDQIESTIDRLIGKLQLYNGEYLRWWELLLSILAGLTAYSAPLWLLYFHRKVRNMEMRHEIYQFQTVISILRGVERISVESILEWLNRFAVIFKIPIQKSLLHYEHGAESALLELKDDVWFPDFQRLVDKLLLAVDKVPIKDVFDDLDGEMIFSFEQRKQEYEAMIDTKAAWARMIGFTPMYALIFMYLVIPLIGMSFSQMETYYEQIQRL